MIRTFLSYAQAESLHSQLDTLSRSLSTMIEEVNVLSSNGPIAAVGNVTDESSSPPAESSSPSPSEDPISQISQILNAHLTSLQWIDGTSSGMKTKVVELERKMSEINGPGQGGGRRALEISLGASRREGGNGGNGGSGRFGLGRR